MTSESYRLSRKMNCVAQSCSNAAVLEARRFYAANCESGNCGRVEPDPPQKVQLESDHLSALVATCFSSVIGRGPVEPESIRIQKAAACSIAAYNDQTNPETRFVQYRPPVIPPVCPAIPTEILNANIPKASKRCPLPNKGFNPNLPA